MKRRVEIGPHSDTAITRSGNGVAAIDWSEGGARCGRAACIESHTPRVLHVCSIHSAEKGKKGQVVIAAAGEQKETGAGETLEAAAAFRNLTFSILPPPKLPSLPRALSFEAFFFFALFSSPFAQTRTIPPRIGSPCRISPRLLPDHRLMILGISQDVTIIRDSSESPAG